MLNKSLWSITILVFFLILSGCKSSDNNKAGFSKSYGFFNNQEGWIWGFADYPPGSEGFYELSGGFSKLPAPLSSSTGSIKISGNNHSDDLFMYIKKLITGLKPDTEYIGTISMTLASNAAEGSFGIGGSPASSVYLKVGIVPQEPLSVTNGGYYRISIDKGNQATEGKDMMNIGNISNGISTTEYRMIERRSSVIKFRSSNNGTCWVIIGTDSGFEGTTTLYYDTINVELEAVN